MGNAFGKMGRCALFSTFLLFVCLVGNAQPERDIPDNNLAYPVLLLSKTEADKIESGSGFFYNKENAVYLITARHVLFKDTLVKMAERFPIPKLLRHKIRWQGAEERGTFLLVFSGVMLDGERQELIRLAPNSDSYRKAIDQLYEESQKLKLKSNETTLFSYPARIDDTGVNRFEVRLASLFDSGKIKYHPSSDVALINIGTPEKSGGRERTKLSEAIAVKEGHGFIGLGKDNFKLYKDVLVGNRVFVFGYPTTLTAINPWLDVKLPLLRKGVVAGKNAQLKAIILDCPAFGGNSGGLVIESEQMSVSTFNYKAIGVITNYVPYQQEWVENSGYSVAVPMDFVEELISGKTN